MTNSKLELTYAIYKKPTGITRTSNKLNEFEFLEKAFINQDVKFHKNYINVEVNNKNYCVHYKKERITDNIIDLIAKTSCAEYYTFYLIGYSDEVQALVLSELYKKIYGNAKDEYYFIKIYDSVSNYYIQKINPFILEYESRLKEIIYLATLKKHEYNLYEVVFRDLREEDKNRINRENTELERIEQTLHLLSLGNIEFFIYPRNQEDNNELNEFKNTIENRGIDRDILESARTLRNNIYHKNSFHTEEYLIRKREIQDILVTLDMCKLDIIRANNIETLNNIYNDLNKHIYNFVRLFANSLIVSLEIMIDVSDILSSEGYSIKVGDLGEFSKYLSNNNFNKKYNNITKPEDLSKILAEEYKSYINM